jgi:hypothetical protein
MRRICSDRASPKAALPLAFFKPEMIENPQHRAVEIGYDVFQLHIQRVDLVQIPVPHRRPGPAGVTRKLEIQRRFPRTFQQAGLVGSPVQPIEVAALNPGPSAAGDPCCRPAPRTVIWLTGMSAT